jgi:hypothetical protein
MPAVPDVWRLLELLRAAGLGVDEGLRIERALVSLAHDGVSLEQRLMRSVVASVVVKSADAATRFNDTFAHWYSSWDAAIERHRGARAAAGDRAPAPEPATTVSVVRQRRAAGEGASSLPPATHPRMLARLRKPVVWMLLSMTAACLGWIALRYLGAKIPDLAAFLLEGQRPLTAVYRSLQREALSPLGPYLTLGAGALLMGGLLWRRYGRQGSLPPPAEATTRAGLPFILPAAPQPGGAQPFYLLDPGSEYTLVWGIGQFISEETSERLDIARSVAATAGAAGRPVLRFRRTRKDREVWLWIDQAVGAAEPQARPSLQRFAAEIGQALVRAGLRVERAWFQDAPDPLWTEAGRFEPGDFDERREAALVGIFTDGYGLARRLRDDSERPHLVQLLRLLGQFPRLAFVDFGWGASGLAGLLAPFEIPVILPDALPAFFGSEAIPNPGPLPARRASLTGDTRAWAAACALAPFPVDESHAHSLRTKLKLACPAWDIDRIRALGTSSGQRFSLPLPVKAPLLRWLRLVSEGAKAGGVLRQALDIWKARLDETTEERESRDSIEPWIGTPAARRLLVDRAMLDLWDEPKNASWTLYRLHGPPLAPPPREDELRKRHPLRTLIQQRMAEHGPVDCTHPDRVAMPWAPDSCEPLVRVMLQSMGFGRGHCESRRERLRRPARYHFALGLVAGMLAASVLGFLLH